MGRNRFVHVQTTRIDISDGDWIEIKDKLSYGEQSKLTGTMTPSMSPSDSKRDDKGTTVEVDWAEYAIQKMLAYLVDWSFTDEKDKHVPVSRDAIFALDQDTSAEIERAIDDFLANASNVSSPKVTPIKSPKS